MAKLNRGNSHISIGQYMTQAGWPLVGRVRSVFGYDDEQLFPLNVNHEFCDVDLDVYDTESPYNTEDCASHIQYANKNGLYQLFYRIVGHDIDEDGDVYPVISTLDNPELLVSSTHNRFDPTCVPSDHDLSELPEGGAMVKRKLTQGWQQFRGSFEPMRKSLKGLTKVFSRYKSSKEVLHNDAMSFVYGIGNIIEGVTQIVLVPFFLVFRLLKHVGLLLRHPFTGASYSNLVVRFARDIGYSITWLIEGSLETVQGVLRIVMQLPKWLIQMPVRGLRTAVSGYATFKENAGTQTLIRSINQEINTQLAEQVKQDKVSISYFQQRAQGIYELFILGKNAPEDFQWEDLRRLIVNVLNSQDPDLLDSVWHQFRAHAGYGLIEFESLLGDQANREAKKEQLIAIIRDGMKNYYLDGLESKTKLSENVHAMFYEMRWKRFFADSKGQEIGSTVSVEQYADSVSSARKIVQAFNPEAVVFTLPR